MFRSEAARQAHTRLQGNVHLFVPTSWHLIGHGLLAFLVASSIFLAVGSYARVETVTGQVEPDLGSASIVPTRTGIVTSVLVQDGATVRAGTPLAAVRAEETDAGGTTGPENVLQALREQDARLAAQQKSIMEGADATRTRLRDQASGLRDEIFALDEQIAAQKHLIETAETDWSRIQDVARQGFISKHDLQQREDVVTSRRQQLAALVQARAEKAAGLSGSEQAVDEATTNARAAAAGIAGNRASVVQQESNVSASRGFTLTAPVAGTITAVTARVGQSAQAGQQLMTLVPAGARLQAWLYVPTQAVGFLAKGQEVRLQIDAFPYSRFGTVAARVERISTAAVDRPVGGGQSEPFYIVAASIRDPGIYAFGGVHRLQPDMTLTARIITERRSLVEWLFEPILAVRRR